MQKVADFDEYNTGNQYGAQLYGYEYNPYVPGRGWALYGNYQAVNQREVCTAMQYFCCCLDELVECNVCVALPFMWYTNL